MTRVNFMRSYSAILLLYHSSSLYCRARFVCPSMSALYAASSAGDVDAIRQLLLRHGEDINTVDEITEYGSPLIVAAAKGNLLIVNLLLEANADPDTELYGRGSAILHACLAGHVDVVRALIAAGADISSHQPGYNNSTPLELACSMGQTTIVRLLLDAGVQPNRPLPEHPGDFVTPLYVAAKQGFPDIVEMLLERGANVNGLSSFGYGYVTPLYAAICCNIVDYFGRGPVPHLFGQEKEQVRDAIIRQLVDAGANMDDVVAFREAASLGQLAIVESFIEAGIDVNNFVHGTAISVAAAHGHLEVVSLLLQSGADVNEAGDHEPCALLQAVSAQDEAMVQLLLDSGANTRCRFNELEDLTPLQLATSQDQRHIVSLLLAAGAAVDDNDDIDATGDQEREVEDQTRDETALSIAVYYNRYEIASMLIEAGANVNAKNGGVLCTAAQNGNDEIVQLLIRQGAIIEPPGGDCSPLYFAALRGHLSTVTLLLDAGASVGRVFEYGRCRSVLSAAQYSGNNEIVQLLRSYNAIE